MGDPGARLPEVAAGLIVDELPGRAGFLGKPGESRWTVDVVTSGPDRRFVLRTGDAVALEADHEAGGGGESDATLILPAEALVRLVYGRLDGDHASSARVDGAGGLSLDDVRAIFPGL
jgi:hypothetical protein